MKKLNQLNREHVWFASILLFFVLGCLVMKSCIWDEIPKTTEQPKQVIEVFEGLVDLDEEIKTLEEEINVLTYEIVAVQEEIEKNLQDLRILEIYVNSGRGNLRPKK